MPQDRAPERLVVKGTGSAVENVVMRTPGHAPEPELATDLRPTTDLDPEADPWSSGSIVFSLGPDFDDPSFTSSPKIPTG